MTAGSRKGSRRRTVCARVIAEETRCWLCGFVVDKRLNRQVHPLAASVDEIVPIALGGSDTDRRNLRLAHRWCNSWRRQTYPWSPTLQAQLHQALAAKGYLVGPTGPGPSRRW